MERVEEYVVKKVDCAHDIVATVPGSKSITNRALLIAAMAKGSSKLTNVLFSDDSRHFLNALKSLGFSVDIDEENATVLVEGMGGKIPCVIEHESVNVNGYEVNGFVNVGSAGTAARFLTAYLGLSEGRFYVDSSEQMKKRPMEELLVALESLGASIEYIEEKYHFPFIIGNTGIDRDEVEIDVDRSSQFLSALLIAAPLFQKSFAIHVKGEHGLSYVEMTVKMMAAFGVRIFREAKTYRIEGNLMYNAMDYFIEPDMSAACYFYAMAPLLQKEVLVKGIHRKSLQGDVAFLSVLERMGCSLCEKPEGVCVKGNSIFHGGEFDLSSFSDQTLTLAAIASFADSPVRIQNVSHIRHQECDRINAIILNLERLKGKVEETEDGIVIYPSLLQGASIETFEDHRVAMSFSLVGLRVDGVVILNPSCCRKTFENYFDVLEDVLY